MFKHINDNDSRFWKVIDLDTGEKIKKCQWANDETGEYKVCLTDEFGNVIKENGDPLFEIRKGNIKFVKINPKDTRYTSYLRGHKIESRGSDWYYSDTGEIADYDRACKKCGEMPTREGYDVCLGYIKGAIAACCGHGVRKPYIKYQRIN